MFVLDEWLSFQNNKNHKIIVKSVGFYTTNNTEIKNVSSSFLYSLEKIEVEIKMKHNQNESDKRNQQKKLEI